MVVGLGWVGLGWVGLGWVGLGWVVGVLLIKIPEPQKYSSWNYINTTSTILTNKY